jgi:type III secretion inner rod protein HrpB2
MAPELHSMLQNVTKDVASPSAPSLDAATSQLGVQFSTLMNRSSAPPSVSSDEGYQTVSSLVLGQEDELNATLNEVDAVTQAMPGMTQEQITAASVRLSVEFASMQFNMETKMSVVNSAKGSLETLMREG